MLAIDASRNRLDRIKRRLGDGIWTNIEIRLGSHLDLPEDATGFDAALVDAPCSNTGVLARRVEVRHRLDEADIHRLSDLQCELLATAVERVRVGGRVLYSTCSLEAAENAGVVGFALRNLPVRHVISHTTLPMAGRRDGGFYALFEVTGRSDAAGVVARPAPRPSVLDARAEPHIETSGDLPDPFGPEYMDDDAR